MTISKLIGKAIFAARGWTFAPLPSYWQTKQVIIGFPHTTILDTLMAFAGFAAVGKKGHVLVKVQAFRWPLAGILRRLGAIPVDRSHPGGLVPQMASIFAERDEFHLALVPEGTRSSHGKIKSGFWHIAKAANVPIACWLLDNKNKRTVWVGQIIPGFSYEKDVEEIRRLYSAAGFDLNSIAK